MSRRRSRWVGGLSLTLSAERRGHPCGADPGGTRGPHHCLVSESSPAYFFRAATSLVIDANIAGNDADTMALLILRSTNPGKGALTSRAAV